MSLGKIGWSKSILRNVRFFKNNPSLFRAPCTNVDIGLPPAKSFEDGPGSPDLDEYFSVDFLQISEEQFHNTRMEI